MKNLLTLLLFPLSLAAQMMTVGPTTTVLNTSQRAAVAQFWPDGNMGAQFHNGTNYVFAPTTNPGTVQLTLPNLNSWTSGLSLVNPATNFSFGPSNSWNNDYIAGQATYLDTTTGILVELVHGEYHYGAGPTGGPPSYAALGLGYSNDFGNTWHLLGEVISPQTIRSPAAGGTNCQADISMGTLLVVGSYFYTYYTDTASGCGALQIAVARAPIASVIAAAQAGTPFTSGPGTLFMKYTGGGNWTGNGVNDLANPQNGGGAFVQVGPTPVVANRTFVPQVRFDSYINKYLMCWTSFYDIECGWSVDGLTNWSSAQVIETGGFDPPNALDYPTLFNTSGGDPQVLGQTFTLFWVFPFGSWPSIQLLSATLSLPGSSSCGTSSPYTAPSSAESDVNSCINGPLHTAVNGDVIRIPCSGTQSATWTSTLNVSASITITGLGATPNTTPSTFGAGTNCLTLIDNNPSGPLFNLTPTYASSNNVTTLQNINIDPVGASTALTNPITIEGTGASAGMPQVRIDNITFGNGTRWTESGNSSNAGSMIKVDNVIGVADHNTLPSGSAVELATVQMSSYLGVGQYGDNSWAQPDSLGGPNNWFNENNLANVSLAFTDCTEGGPSFTESGGCRLVNRFNHIIGPSFDQLTGMHGLDTGGRIRSGRETETYGNTLTCTSACQDFTSFRGGTGVVWGNTGTGFYNGAFDMTTYRNVYGPTPWSYCGGLNALDPWDTNDNTVLHSGTMTSASGLTMTDSGASFSGLLPSGAPYSVYDTTQGFVSEIASFTGTTITVIGPISESSWTAFHSGDAYQIIRSTVCMDQSGRGQGVLISGTTPTPSGPISQALDPVYEWDDSGMNGQVTTNTGRVLANRDWYTDNWKGGGLSGPTAQTSPTTPFNGTTTCSGTYACGVGFGTLANQPTTCTTGVRYFATDQGHWNQSGPSGLGYKCGPTNTWVQDYTPYQYPHPLVTGVSTFSWSAIVTPAAGTITGSNSSSGSYPSGTLIGPLTATPNSGFTFTGWTPTGAANCSGTTNPTSSSFSLTSNSSCTATFTNSSISTCGNPSQIAPNFSGTYPASALPFVVGFSSPTAGCGMFYTADGSTPTCSSTAYPSGNFTISTPGTFVYRVIACQGGFTSSAVIGGTWTVTGPSLVISTAGAGTGTVGGTNCAVGTSFPPTGASVMCTAVPNAGAGVTSSGTGDASACTGSSCTFTFSAGGTLTYTFAAKLAAPTFTPGAGTYNTAQSVNIGLPAGATGCYTTDGSTPTGNGAGTCTHGTTYSTPVSVSSSLTLKAIATESTFTDSAVGSAAYTIVILTPPIVKGNVVITGNVVIK